MFNYQLLTTAYYGGQLVYDYGAAVSTIILNPKIDIDFWVNWQVGCQTRQRPFLRRAVCHQYGEEKKCADNEVWQPNRQFVK